MAARLTPAAPETCHVPQRIDPRLTLVCAGLIAVLVAATACGQSPPSSTVPPPTATETQAGPAGPSTPSQEPVETAGDPLGAPGTPAESPADPQEFPKLPYRALTPGAVRTTDLEDVCNKSTRLVRHTSRGIKRHVMSAYGVLDKPGFVADHLVPLEVGGEDVESNLWAQPLEQSRAKDRCEGRAHRLICRGKLRIEDAQLGFMTDFGAFCRSIGNPVQ